MMGKKTNQRNYPPLIGDPRLCIERRPLLHILAGIFRRPTFSKARSSFYQVFDRKCFDPFGLSSFLLRNG